jgi:membrane-associated phospholipid phosphatase
MRKPAAALSMGCACLAVFIFLLPGETHFGRLAWLDTSVNEMLGRQSAGIILLSKGLHYIFSAISMIVATTALACIFWRKIGRSRAILMTGLILLVAGLNQFIKFAVARPRPVNAIIALRDTAFPSGHTSATTVFVGILCMILLPRLAPGRQRGIMIFASALTAALVGFSRLSLHVHWLTDVLAGLSLGGIVVSFGVLVQEFIRRAPRHEIS